MNANQIVVLDKEKIIEMGNHCALNWNKKEIILNCLEINLQWEINKMADNYIRYEVKKYKIYLPCPALDDTLGNYFDFFDYLNVMFCLLVVKYPDIVSTEIVITTTIPPKVSGRTSGRIETILVQDKSIVKKMYHWLLFEIRLIIKMFFTQSILEDHSEECYFLKIKVYNSRCKCLCSFIQPILPMD
jgi:hypothetical protein